MPCRENAECSLSRPACWLLAAVLLGLAGASSGACSDVRVDAASTSGGNGGGLVVGSEASTGSVGGSAGNGGATSTTGSGEGGGPAGGGPDLARVCRGGIYECGDAIDNDGDGRVDAEDPECTGSCDEVEVSFFAWHQG